MGQSFLSERIAWRALLGVRGLAVENSCDSLRQREVISRDCSCVISPLDTAANRPDRQCDRGNGEVIAFGLEVGFELVCLRTVPLVLQVDSVAAGPAA
jgi:hypothetical protein